MSTGANKYERKTAPSSKMVQTIEKIMQPLRTFITKFMNDWGFILAGVIAYNMLMSMVPIAIALLALLGIVLGDSQIQTNVLGQITAVFPGLAHQQNALKLASEQIQQSSGMLGILAVLLAVLFGSFLFVVIEGCLDILYQVRQRPILPQFLVAIGMFMVFVILMPIMVFVSAGPTLLFAFLDTLPILKSIPSSSFILLSLGSLLGGFVVTFIFFESIYLVVPNQRIQWKNSWCGAAIAALLTEIFLAVFPLVLVHLFGGYVGTIGFAIVILLFFYILAILLLLGAEVNAIFFEGARPLPHDLVTFVSIMAGRLNKDVPETTSPPPL